MRRWPFLLSVVVPLAAAPALAADQSVRATPSASFDPRTVTLAVGEKVTITNAGGIHNVHWEDGGAPTTPAAPESGNWTAERRFDREGEFLYYCDLHGSRNRVGMYGVVNVTATGEAPDTTAPEISGLDGPARVRRGRTARFEYVISEDATVDLAVRPRGKRRGRKGFTDEFEVDEGNSVLRIGTDDLRRGRWRLALTATDAAGNESDPERIRFRVRKPG